jgi:hypothetical protein
MNDYIPYSRFDRDLNPARCFSGGTYRFGERTHFLAYMWTALTLLVSGITFIKLLDHVWLEILGRVLYSVGNLRFFVYDLCRYRGCAGGWSRFIWSNRIDGLISDIPAPLFPDVFGKVARWPGSGQILPFICAYDAKIADF